MNGDPIIRVVAMDAGYEGSPAILENVNFEVGRGQVFGILGGSGCFRRLQDRRGSTVRTSSPLKVPTCSRSGANSA